MTGIYLVYHTYMDQVVTGIYLVYTRYIPEKVNFWGFQMKL